MTDLTKRRFLVTGAAAVAAGMAPARARAESVVDLLLVLSADVSRSVDDEKFKLQRDGYAAAIADPAVMRLIQAGPHGSIGMALVEWSNAGSASVMVPWTQIARTADAEAFSQRVRAAPRLYRDRTSISTGIDYAVQLLERAPFTADRKVIDVSGDGTHNSGRDVTVARDEALAEGVVINGIVILSAVPLAINPTHTHPPGGLQKYYEDNVIGGPGAFAMAAESFQTFGQAFRQKLIKEIA